MVDGLYFDLILAGTMVALAIWEAVVAVRRGERKRFTVVALALIGATVLLALRAPQWLPDGPP